MTGKARFRVREVALARKNMDMDAGKLAAAREILGTSTDTETVDRALDYVVFQSEVMGALERLATRGTLRDPYDTRPIRRRRPKRS